jgi:hypothetical protein
VTDAVLSEMLIACPDGLVIEVPEPKLKVPPEPPTMSIPASPPLSELVPVKL